MYNKIHWMLSAVALVSALAYGCSNAGDRIGEKDPIELSAYLFGGKPDHRDTQPDPYDPEREIIWEIRNLLRTKSFLAKSCAKSTSPACRSLVLGYVDHRLDGSWEVAVSLPGMAMAGIRDAKDEFRDDVKACRLFYDPVKGELIKNPDFCSPEAAGYLADLLDARLDIKSSLGTQFQNPAECLLVMVAMAVCLGKDDESCFGPVGEFLNEKVEACPESREWIEAFQDCPPRFRKGCSNDQVWWFDYCDTAHEFVKECPSGCAQGECMDVLRAKCAQGCHAQDRLADATWRDRCYFSAHGDTTLSSPQGRLDKYACTKYGEDMYLDESGPEIIHPYFAERDGAILVTLTPDRDQEKGSSVDLDLLLLKGACEAQACVQHDNSGMFAGVEKGGCYYIVVDGYEGSKGSYDLTVSDPYCQRDTQCEDADCGVSCQWEAWGYEFAGYCNTEGTCVLPSEFDFCLDWIPSQPTGLEFTRSEVTVEQYRRCVNADKCPPPDYQASADCHYQGPELYANHPANCISWQEAEAYCSWVQGRLPTRDEWTAEASDNGRRRSPWGDEDITCEHAVWAGNMDTGECGGEDIGPVCSKEMGNSVSGLCDMNGSLWEWTSTAVHDGWMNMCGGSGISVLPADYPAFFCVGAYETSKIPFTGFRCVRDPG